MTLKDLVRATGLRQTYIAEKAGIPPVRLSLIINGRTQYVRPAEADRLNAVVPGAGKYCLPRLMPPNLVTLEAAGLTQDELARETGIAKTRLNNILHGRAPMRDSERVRIANALGVAPDDIE